VEHVGRTVIYRSHNNAEAGTLTSWKTDSHGNRIVFARYGRGDTAAGAKTCDLSLAIRSVPLSEIEDDRPS
jgi:hypothetical protein